MTAVVVLALSYWLSCSFLSLLPRSDRAFVAHPAFHLFSLAGLLALAAACARACVGLGRFGLPGAMLLIVIGLGLAVPYLRFVMGEWVGRAHAAAIGTERMTVIPTYDRAGKAEHDGDFEAAFREYALAAAEAPKDPEPRRRMAEVRLRQGRVDEALVQFRAALGLQESADERAIIAFRMADVLDAAGRRAEARALVEETAKRVVGTKFEKYARERLASAASAEGRRP